MIRRILFVHNAATSFVKIDLAILRERFVVEELFLESKAGIHPPAIWKAVRRNDLVFAWFASWHSLLPVYFASLQHKTSILVTGGYDTANVPEAGYGNQRSWWKRSITNYIIRKSTRVICNSDFAKKEIIAATGISDNKISRIYHGIAEHSMRPKEKLNIALNVGNVLEENLLRKGIEPFLATGQLLPSYQFIQAGQWKDSSIGKLKKYESINVEIRGLVSDMELQALYTCSKVYVQPSLHEAFGMSVVEAMQMGCIPVVSPYGALPEVVGKYGIVLEDTSPAAIASGIRTAECFTYSPEEIRNYVLQKYSLDKRRKALLQCIALFDKSIDIGDGIVYQKELNTQLH